MKPRQKVLRVLLCVLILSHIFAAPMAAAAKEQGAVTPVGFDVNFDTNLPDGAVYTLTVDGLPHTVTAIPGTDLTLQFIIGWSVEFSYSAYAYLGEGTRYSLSGTVPASPVVIPESGLATDVMATYGSREYKVAFDQTGLPVGTPYYADWSMASAIHPIIAGTPYVEWMPSGNEFYASFQDPVFTPLGVYNLGSIQNVTPDHYDFGGTPFYDAKPLQTFIAAYVSGNITGTVFWDYNNNGVQDPGEPGIPNINVQLLGVTQVFPDGGIDSLAAPGGLNTLMTTISDGNGGYAFNFLPAGTFYIRATLPDGSQQDSAPITLAVTDGAMNSGQANFPEMTALPYTGK